MVNGVDQLEYTDDFVLVIFHRHRQKRLGTIAGHLVELARSRKIKTLLGVGIGDIHRLVVDRRVGRNQGIVRLAILAIERQILELRRNRLPGRTTVGDSQRIRANDGKTQPLAIIAHPVERSSVGVRNGLGRQQNIFKQAVEIAFV